MPASKPKKSALNVEDLVARFINRKAKIGVIGLGYVGLPLICAICEKNFNATGFDVDAGKIDKLKRGKSYIGNIHNNRIAGFVKSGKLKPTSKFHHVDGRYHGRHRTAARADAPATGISLQAQRVRETPVGTLGAISSKTRFGPKAGALAAATQLTAVNSDRLRESSDYSAWCADRDEICDNGRAKRPSPG